MKKRFSTLALVATALMCGSSIAQDQATPPDPFSNPKAAIEARIGVHRLMGANLMDAGKKLQAMAAARKVEGQEAQDKALDDVKFYGYEALNRVSALEQLSQMSREFFLVPNSYEGSNAKASIVDNLADYKDKERALVTATFGLRTAVNNRDAKSGMKAVMATMKACNSCHQAYMTEPLWIGPKQPPAAQH
jgi:hypothetical protein